MDQEMLDRLAIRDLIENWALWRDAGFWDKFRTCWHDDGRMMATWTQGTADEFIKMSREGWDKGVSILHFLGGTTIELGEGDWRDRAVVQTKMTISQRGEVDDTLVDVVCTGRFYDLVEKRDGRWGVVLRQPIYEKDRMDPVDPAEAVELDLDILDLYPVGYQHLAYIQHLIGYPVKDDMPGLTGPMVERLYKLGESWLKGGDPDWPPAR